MRAHGSRTWNFARQSALELPKLVDEGTSHSPGDYLPPLRRSSDPDRRFQRACTVLDWRSHALRNRNAAEVYAEVDETVNSRRARCVGEFARRGVQMSYLGVDDENHSSDSS